MNQEEHLTVVANTREIEDAESFARQVIRMCQDNSFKSIRFSTDVNGYPHSLEISVYLRKDDVGEKEPIHKIEFLPDEWNQGYDIRNDVEHILLLDGKEIEFS